MKFLNELPFMAEYDGDELRLGMWKSDILNTCEMFEGDAGECDTSNIFYGMVGDSSEQKWCGRHFYMNVLPAYKILEFTLPKGMK